MGRIRADIVLESWLFRLRDRGSQPYIILDTYVILTYLLT